MYNLAFRTSRCHTPPRRPTEDDPPGPVGPILAPRAADMSAPPTLHQIAHLRGPHTTITRTPTRDSRLDLPGRMLHLRRALAFGQGHLFGRLKERSLVDIISQQAQQFFGRRQQPPLLLGESKQKCDALITIQGGALYGLCLLGQAEEVLRSFNPIAFSGTSAGALVATLLWARGDSPSSTESTATEDLFEKLAVDGSLATLLGGNDQDVSSILAQLNQASGIATSLTNGLLGGLASVICNCRFIRRLLRERGLFSGQRLRKLLGEQLGQSPSFRDAARSASTTVLDLTFGQLNTHLHKTRRYLPPLFIGATNVTNGTFEAISSIDPAYSEYPITKAVLASCAIPGVIRPVAIGTSEYVDGGLFQNFPASVFLRFRDRIAQTPVHRHLASKTCLHVGCQVVETPDGGEQPALRAFWDTIRRIILGRSRNELEGRLREHLPRSISIRQPSSDTSGPRNWLDFASVDEARVVAMIKKGRDSARREIDSIPTRITNAIPDVVRTHIHREMQALQFAIAELLNVPRDTVRVFLFAADESDLHPICWVNVADTDSDKRIRVPHGTAVVGNAYFRQSVVLCNLELLRQSMKEGAQHQEYQGQPKSWHKVVRKDRAFVMAAPIFDPLDVSGGYEGSHQSFDKSVAISCGHIGGVLGALSVDVGAPYTDSRHPRDTCNSEVTRSCMRILVATSFTIGQRLSAEWEIRHEDKED